jgi:hypothetical protein
MADCSPKNCETLDETKYKGVGCQLVMEGGEAPVVTGGQALAEHEISRKSGLRVGLDYTSDLDRRQTRTRRDVRYPVCHHGIGKLPACC